MNLSKLEKIINQIMKYQLQDELEYIEEWISKLNDRQIDNFINLNIYPLKKNLAFKKEIVDLDLLNSKFYLKDIILIIDAKSDEIASCLADVARNEKSLQREYHAKDMELISNATSDEIASCLASVAYNELSLKSEYHAQDMELISNAKSDDIASCLADVARNEKSLKSEYHVQDMKLLAFIKFQDDVLTNDKKLEILYNMAVIYVDCDKEKNFDMSKIVNYLKIKNE